MKILHTADIHLNEYQGERWKVLEELLKIGKEQKIDLFIISGDLFDKNIESEKLHVYIRELFSGNEFDIIILPGNHDAESYEKGMFYGNNVKILNNLENPIDDYEEVLIMGIPFESIGRDELRTKIRSIKDIASDSKTNILLFHGELLDHSFTRDDFGSEESSYMGVKLSYFENLKLKYIVAGHFHSNFDVYELKEGGYFIYPGSPISITRKEKGKRAISLIEVGKPPEKIIVNTPYYKEIEITLYPSEEEKSFKMLKNRLHDLPENARIIVNVKGFTDKSEDDLQGKFEEIASKRDNVELLYLVSGISYIIEDELFKAFDRKLKTNKEPREEEIRNLFIKGMIEVKKS
jgi:DNA repair exonuclease SbcCD nuclease subunit